jgi:hypothetical protein
MHATITKERKKKRKQTHVVTNFKLLENISMQQ